MGARATTTQALIGSDARDFTNIIIDSGSDITLISQEALNAMPTPPRIQGGQKISLIQVTGKSTIKGFVDLPVIFETNDGPVELQVEAYVVKGMNAPFILGNDYSDQYSLSVLRKDGETHLVFGETGRRRSIENSVGPTFSDEDGHTFRIMHATVKKGGQRRPVKVKARRELTEAVRAAENVLLPPGVATFVPVKAKFPGGIDHAYVEKVVNGRKGEDDLLVAPDSIVQKNQPFLHVSNLSSRPIRVREGELLGLLHDPREWLTQWNEETEENAPYLAHSQAVKTFVKELGSSQTEDPHVESEPEIEGGPKTWESPDPDVVKRDDLATTIDLPDHLSPEQRNQLTCVINKHDRAFGLDGRLGKYDAKVRIHLRDDAKEISLPPYTTSPAKREVIDKQLDAWLSQEVIEPSESPWGFPVLIVYRNDKPRLCIDYRRLNAVTIPDEFPIPKQSDIIQALTGSQWLSTLDALSGFTQLEISPEDKPKTAFRTHRGLHQFRRLPFGLRNGPGIFQRVMQNVLAPYLWIFALVYIDDVVIFSKTFEDHIKHIDQVLHAVEKAGLTMSPGKCHFGYQSLLLLGQKVSRLGMSTHKEKVDAIVALEEPRNAPELRTFLGMMVYFSSYMPFYAWIVSPLFALLKKDVPWTWGPLEREAWELSKISLVQAPIRAYAIPGLGFRLYTDACDYGLAGILQQVQPIRVGDLKGTKIYDRIKKAHDEGKDVPVLVSPVSKETRDEAVGTKWGPTLDETTVHIERVVAYWSRILKAAERNYSPTEREALALKESLVKFQAFIEGERLVAITDHAALTWSKTFQNVNRRLLSWGTVFAAYPDMEIVHRAGRVHSNVDPISRLRRRTPFQYGPAVDDSAELALSEDPTDPNGETHADEGSSYENRVMELVKGLTEKGKIRSQAKNPIIPLQIELEDAEVNVMTTKCITTWVSITDDEIRHIVAAYRHDPYFSAILEDLRTETDWNNPRHGEFRVDEKGLLFYEDWAGHSRLCVPRSERNDILRETHERITLGAHAGYYRTYNRIASTYYWPRMSRDIKKFVSTCDICQKVKVRRHLPYGLLQPIPIPTEPFEVVSMDFIPDLPESDGFNNILVIVDKLTKYGIFIPTTTKIDEIDTAKLFFRHVYLPYGMPKQIISDRDPRWSNSFWKTLTHLMGARRALTTAHHPQADGQTEVLNQFLEVGLRTFTGPNRDDWAGKVAAFEHSYNTGVQSSTGFTPAYLLRGYEPREPYHILPGGPAPITRVNDSNLDAEEFEQGISAVRKQAQMALHFAQEHQRTAYNRGRLAREYEEGDLVVINPHSMALTRDIEGKGKKLLARYEGPFEIIQKISPITYRLRIPASYRIHPIVSIAHLEPYQSSPPEFGERSERPSLRSTFKELPEAVVERVLKQRTRTKGRKRVVEYLVRFEGLGAEQDEWISASGLTNAPESIRDWERLRDQTHPQNTYQSIPPVPDTSLGETLTKGESQGPEPNPAVRTSNRHREKSSRAQGNEELRRLGLGRREDPYGRV